MMCETLHGVQLEPYWVSVLGYCLWTLVSFLLTAVWQTCWHKRSVTGWRLLLWSPLFSVLNALWAVFMLGWSVSQVLISGTRFSWALYEQTYTAAIESSLLVTAYQGMLKFYVQIVFEDWMVGEAWERRMQYELTGVPYRRLADQHDTWNDTAFVFAVFVMMLFTPIFVTHMIPALVLYVFPISCCFVFVLCLACRYGAAHRPVLLESSGFRPTCLAFVLHACFFFVCSQLLLTLFHYVCLFYAGNHDYLHIPLIEFEMRSTQCWFKAVDSRVQQALIFLGTLV